MENWAVVQSFTLSDQAHLAQAYLESEGIESMLTNELAFQTINIYTAGTGSIRMWVMEADYEKALSILINGGYINEKDVFPRKVETVDGTIYTDKTTCPFCGSRKVLLKTKTDIFVSLVYKVIGLFSPAFKAIYGCQNCRRAWRYK